MTYTQQLIQKGIEGGWHKKEHDLPIGEIGKDKVEIYRNKKPKPTEKEIFALHYGWGEGVRDAWIFNDPDFWQALGKALEWEKDCFCEIVYRFLGEEVSKAIPEWYAQMHKFIDHLAEGKTTEEFAKKLLK